MDKVGKRLEPTIKLKKTTAEKETTYSKIISYTSLIENSKLPKWTFPHSSPKKLKILRVFIKFLLKIPIILYVHFFKLYALNGLILSIIFLIDI